MHLHNYKNYLAAIAAVALSISLLLTCSQARAAVPSVGESKTLYVTADQETYLFNTPKEDCEVQTPLREGDMVTLLEFQEDDDADSDIWYRVSMEEGQIGYVHKKDVAGRRKAIREMIDYALTFVGNPYVYGGSSLTNGTDCSGFTMRIYETMGISLPHSSSEQSSCGTAVDLDEVKAGDLIFYGEGGIHHVALYIGDGQIVHAANSSKGIIQSDMNYETPVKARRMIPEGSGS